MAVGSAQTTNRYIARVDGGATVIQTICALLGCNVEWSLGDPKGEVFLVTDTSSNFLDTLLQQTAVIDAEPDLLSSLQSSSNSVPPALYDSTPVDYYGTIVPQGYVDQPATQIIRLNYTQTSYNVNGRGIVAVIDTGIDPNHPVFQNLLVPGYDFTRNQAGEGDETADVLFPSQPSADPDGSAWTNPNTAAKVTQSTAAVVDGNPAYGDFGHGTMVAGIIHLVAPGAMLMPLKAFSANGTGYTSDIVRAIYFAVQNNANVLNMSFNLAAASQEVKSALDYATFNGLISVASAGNNGEDTVVYPAAYNNVVGVASTNNQDQRSSFSNYGTPPVWVAAPGEGVVTTYPFSTYAAGWGTSFSAPFVSGTAALMLDSGSSLLTDILVFQDQWDCARSVAHAQQTSPPLGNGRLDTYEAIAAWHRAMGGL